MTMTEFAQRFPPPLSRSTVNEKGERVPMIEPSFVECGHRVHIKGVLVECIRRKGHPVALNFAHTNGYVEWVFDEPASMHSETEGENK